MADANIMLAMKYSAHPVGEKDIPAKETNLPVDERIPMLIENVVIRLATGLVINAVPATLVWLKTAASADTAWTCHGLVGMG